MSDPTTSNLQIDVPDLYGKNPEGVPGNPAFCGDHWHGLRAAPDGGAEYLCMRTWSKWRHLFWHGRRPVGLCPCCLSPMIAVTYGPA